MKNKNEKKKDLPKKEEVRELKFSWDIREAVKIWSVIHSMKPSVIAAHKELRDRVCEKILKLYPEAKEPGERPNDKREISIDKRELAAIAQGILALMEDKETKQADYVELKNAAKKLRVWENYLLEKMIKVDQVDPFAEDLDGEEFEVDAEPEQAPEEGAKE